jgi:prophage antirepressor-like protein
MQLQVFKFEEEDHLSEVRTVEIDGEIWFVATDVARTLGYKRPIEAVRQHCKDKGTVKYRIPSEGGEQETLLINEPNVYRLIIKSQLPSAEKFENWLFEEVIPSIRKKGFYGRIDRTALPNFIERYKENYHKLDKNYFSVISEMFARLYMELEKVGYVIPDKGYKGQQLMPDISVGKTFAKYLKDYYPEHFITHKTYIHTFPDGKEVEANQYDIEVLPLFIKFINQEWIPKYAENYFKTRDPLALDYLPKLLTR